ncbi:CdaR family protein [Thomasclavelia sp.]|uniref:CdaR family protein n=1 Tax=Thomasclavelia sp. TaxID=3025757 RepID=UPI002612877E|nr:CdaR family protein [Thomasclavelia sp.]
MSKKDNQKPSIKKDTTTDFFLNFINRQKSENKKSDKQPTIKPNEELLNVKDKSFEFVYKSVNSLNLFLDRMLQSNLSMKILSFIIAIVLLFTINGNINNIFSTPNGGDYIYDVKISVRGLQDDYDVVGLPETVDVALVGPSIDIYAAKLSKNYKIIADFSSLGEGDHTIELKSEGFPTNLQVMIVPQTVSVKITQKYTETFELGYDFINEDKMDNKYSVSVESMEHQQVEIRGSQDVIGKINSVKANIDLSEINESFEQDAKIYAYDRSGKKLDVEIIPDSVHVQCDVSSYSKEVPIVPKYVGQFESGYGLKEVTLSKDKVRIYGKEELLNSVNSVNVIIDISGLSGDKTYEKLPITEMEKINKLSFDTVDVSVKVSPAVKKIITDIPINIINNTHDYRVVFANEVDKVSIEVEGVEELLNNVSANDFNATINIENLKSGTNTVKVDLNTNKSYLSYKLLSPEKIKITLKK